MKVQDVYDWLASVAPFDTAASFDNVGLLIGDPAATVHKTVFCVDATHDVIQEAVRLGAELIVSHHPLMFGGTKHIRYDQPEGRVLAELTAARLNLIAAHTNFDQAVGGTGDSLADCLGAQELQRVNDYLRMAQLPAPLSSQELLTLVQDRLHAPVRMYGAARSSIAKIALGAGALGCDEAIAAEAGAEAYIVGEVHHHELLDACARGMVVYEAGHYPTEFPGMQALYHRFLTDAAPAEAHLFTQAPYPGATLAS